MISNSNRAPLTQVSTLRAHFVRRDKHYASVVGGLSQHHQREENGRKNDDLFAKPLLLNLDEEAQAIPLDLSSFKRPKSAEFK